jgi:TonB-dependent receptor
MFRERFTLPQRAPIALVTLLLAAAPAFAAENGSISGHVLDSKNHPLSGAAIVVTPGNQSLVSDQEGAFTLRGLAAGAYHLEILYLGYATEEKDVTVTADGAATVTAHLKLSVHNTQVITVSATRINGEVEALNQEKNAQDIVNVLPVDVITSLPNANMADALGRLPSVSLERDEGEGKYVQVRGLESRYTSVTIDGVRMPSAESGVRQVKLDGFPSDFVETVELHKTVSPDAEGDALGGSVNMVTRIAPENGMLLVDVNGGYNPQANGRHNDHLAAGWGARFGDSHQWGLMLVASNDYNGRSINDVEPGPAMMQVGADGPTIPQFSGADYRYYLYDRHRFGVAGTLDYRQDANNTYFLRAYYSDFKNYGDRWVRTANVGSLVTPTTDDGSGNYTASVQNRRPDEQYHAYSFGAKHELGSAVLDYTLSVAHAQQHRDNELTAKFKGPATAFTIDASDPYFPEFNSQAGVNPLDPSKYKLKQVNQVFEDTDTSSNGLGANLLLPTDAGTWKFGIKYRDEKKTNSYNNTLYHAKGTYLMSQGLMDFTDSRYYQGRFPAGPFANLYSAAAWVMTPGNFTTLTDDAHFNNDPNQWTAREKVAAGYAMDTLSWASDKLSVGARVEHTSDDSTGNVVTANADGSWASTTPYAGSTSYTTFLPSVSWRHEFDRDSILRAVVGTGLARPNYQDLIPSVSVTNPASGDSGQKGQISQGNPALKPTTAVNYDLLFEKYFTTIGQFSAGIFYKDLTNPIYEGSVSTVVGGVYNGYLMNKPVNGPSANVAGFEVAWKEHLSFLPGFLSGLGVDLNYTHTHSRATFDPSTGRTGTAPLQRTAPEEGNAGLTYDKGPFSFRIAATYNSAMIFAYQYQDGADGGPAGPQGDQYLYPHTQLDAQGSWAFKNGVKVVFSVLNLNNAVFGFYNGSPRWNVQREFYNRTFNLGIRWTL